MAVRKQLPKIQPSPLKSNLDPVKVREALLALRAERRAQAQVRSTPPRGR